MKPKKNRDSDRRSTDRRCADVSISFENRRKVNRRLGIDRRH